MLINFSSSSFKLVANKEKSLIKEASKHGTRQINIRDKHTPFEMDMIKRFCSSNPKCGSYYYTVIFKGSAVPIYDSFALTYPASQTRATVFKDANQDNESKGYAAVAIPQAMVPVLFKAMSQNLPEQTVKDIKKFMRVDNKVYKKLFSWNNQNIRRKLEEEFNEACNQDKYEPKIARALKDLFQISTTAENNALIKHYMRTHFIDGLQHWNITQKTSDVLYTIVQNLKAGEYDLDPTLKKWAKDTKNFWG